MSVSCGLGGWGSLVEYNLTESDLSGVRESMASVVCSNQVFYCRDQLQAISVQKLALMAQIKKDAADAAAKAAQEQEEALEAQHGGKEGLLKWRLEQHEIQVAKAAKEAEAAEMARRYAALEKMMKLRYNLSLVSQISKYSLPENIPDMYKAQIEKYFGLKKKDIDAMPVVKRFNPNNVKQRVFYNPHVVMAKVAERFGHEALEQAKTRLWATKSYSEVRELEQLERAYPEEARDAKERVVSDLTLELERLERSYPAMAQGADASHRLVSDLKLRRERAIARGVKA
uniref:Uncharacterized protein n=1 Tax=Hemiselmis andersenii TaxID=464988 RepID=A0A7S1DSZ7_HEMAN|mmetsp:Transcript_2649/g.6244  ORF Transcript_2649/g.6244 Transcript_2649/m.6244 type:complete len:286 (+) Transcript_2649:164-1021(+)